MSNKFYIVLYFLGALVILSVAIYYYYMANLELPEYKVYFSEGNIEIRDYSPMVIAEAEVAGEREAAIQEGFRILADYIFGNNKVVSSANMIESSAQSSAKETNTKISMTAPVQQQLTKQGWQVSFVMPSKYSLENLPKPANPAIKLKKIPASRYLVIKFSGTSSKKNITKYEVALLDYVQANSLKVSGFFKYAFYNPPWTLPFMRRNEVMLLIE